jgi:hypothetical protein
MFVTGDSHAHAYRQCSRGSQRKTVRGIDLRVSGICLHESDGSDRRAVAEMSGIRTPNHCGLRSSAGPGDDVFLPSLRISRFRDRWGGPEDSKNGATDPEAVREADKFVKMLRSKGAIVLEAPNAVSLASVSLLGLVQPQQFDPCRRLLRVTARIWCSESERDGCRERDC